MLSSTSGNPPTAERPREPISWADIRAEAARRFGVTRFRPGQRELIESVLAGRNALGLLPTGGGKSLCYQLPAVFLDGAVIVVSPLIALTTRTTRCPARWAAMARRATLRIRSIEPTEVPPNFWTTRATEIPGRHR